MIECWPGRRTSFLRAGMCMEFWSSQGDRERHRVAIGKSACFDVETVVEIDGVKAGPTRSHIALRTLRKDRSKPRTASGSSDSCTSSELELVVEKPGRYSLPIQDITRIRCKSIHQGKASLECRDSVFLLSASVQNELDKLLEFVRDAKCKNLLPDDRLCATCKEKGERKKAKQKRDQQPAVLECSFRRKQLPTFVGAGQEQVYLKDLLHHSDDDYVPRKLHKMRSSLDDHSVRSVESESNFIRHSNPLSDTIWTKRKKSDEKSQGSPERNNDRQVRDHRISSPPRRVMFIDEVLKCAADGPRRREAQRIVNERRKDIQRGVRVKISDNEKENFKAPVKEDARRVSENLAAECAEERKGISDARRKVYEGQSRIGDEFVGGGERRCIESEEKRRAEQRDKILSRRESLRKLVQLESKRKDQWEMMREEYWSKDEERRQRIGIEMDKMSLNEWALEENRREEDFRKDRSRDSLERIRQEEKRQRLDEDRKIQEQRRREDEEQRAKEAERKLQELKRREEEDKKVKDAERRLQELKLREEQEAKKAKEAERKLQELRRKEEEDKKAKEAERRLQELRRKEDEDKKAKEAERKLQELKRREEEDNKAKETERKLQEQKRKEEEDKKAREAVRKLHDLKQRERKENEKRCKEATRRMQEQVQEQRRKQIEEKVEEALKYFKFDECRQEMREREEMRHFEGAVKSTIRLPQRFRSRVWEEELVVEGCGRVLEEVREKTELRKFDENMRTWLADEYNSRPRDSSETTANPVDSNVQGLRRGEDVTKTSKQMHLNKAGDGMDSDEQNVHQRSPQGNGDGEAQINTPSQSRPDSDDDEEQNRGFHERVAFLDQYLSFRGIQRARLDEEIRLAKDSEQFNLPGKFSQTERSRQEDQKKQELIRKKAAKAADEQKKKLAQERLRAAKAEAKRLEKLLKEAQKLAKAQERARQQQKAEEHAKRKAASKGCAEFSGFPAVHHLTYDQYEQSWNSIKLSERTSILSYSDIPWPPHDNPLYVEGGDSLVAQRRKLRNALLRWHPDKFLSLCGHRLSPSEREFIEARAKRVAEKVMQWKCKLDSIS